MVRELNVGRILGATATTSWSVLRRYDQHDEFLPRISECSLEEGGSPDRVGVVRRTVREGNVFRDRLISLDDRKRSLAYEFLEGPLPLDHYVAHWRIQPVTASNRSVVLYRSELETPDAPRNKIIQSLERDVNRAQKNLAELVRSSPE